VGEVDHQPRRVGEGEDPEADPPARPEAEGDVAFEIAGEAHLGQRGKARRHPFRLGKRRVAVLIVGRDPCEGDAEEGPAEERQLIAPTLRADRSVLDPCAREGVVELEDHAVEAAVPARSHGDEVRRPGVERLPAEDRDGAGGEGPDGLREGSLGSEGQEAEQAEGEGTRARMGILLI